MAMKQPQPHNSRMTRILIEGASRASALVPNTIQSSQSTAEDFSNQRQPSSNRSHKHPSTYHRSTCTNTSASASTRCTQPQLRTQQQPQHCDPLVFTRAQLLQQQLCTCQVRGRCGKGADPISTPTSWSSTWPDAAPLLGAASQLGASSSCSTAFCTGPP